MTSIKSTSGNAEYSISAGLIRTRPIVETVKRRKQPATGHRTVWLLAFTFAINAWRKSLQSIFIDFKSFSLGEVRIKNRLRCGLQLVCDVIYYSYAVGAAVLFRMIFDFVICAGKWGHSALCQVQPYDNREWLIFIIFNVFLDATHGVFYVYAELMSACDVIQP